jgi:hypothetical protein
VQSLAKVITIAYQVQSDLVKLIAHEDLITGDTYTPVLGVWVI